MADEHAATAVDLTALSIAELEARNHDLAAARWKIRDEQRALRVVLNQKLAEQQAAARLRALRDPNTQRLKPGVAQAVSQLVAAEARADAAASQDTA